jgi:hypothetical protein
LQQGAGIGDEEVAWHSSQEFRLPIRWRCLAVLAPLYGDDLTLGRVAAKPGFRRIE